MVFYNFSNVKDVSVLKRTEKKCFIIDTNSTDQIATNAGSLNVTALQKFDKVTSSTDVYYGKVFFGDEEKRYTDHYVVFKSPETAIKLSTSQVSQFLHVSLIIFTCFLEHLHCKRECNL